jgi:hypothetical protein
MNDQITYDNIVPLLVERVPTLRPLFDEHVRDQNGQVLQHVFFGDLTRYVTSRIDTLNVKPLRSDMTALVDVLDFLEQALLSSDVKVHELVSVSFVENLDPRHSTDERFKSLLGPKLRAAIEAFGK